MSKLRFVYSVAALAVSVWNIDRMVRGMRNQSRDIAKDVVREIARDRLKARKEGRPVMDEIATEVFAELGRNVPGPEPGPVYDITENMLQQAFAKVAGRVLAE